MPRTHLCVVVVVTLPRDHDTSVIVRTHQLLLSPIYYGIYYVPRPVRIQEDHEKVNLDKYFEKDGCRWMDSSHSSDMT